MYVFVELHVWTWCTRLVHALAPPRAWGMCELSCVMHYPCTPVCVCACAVPVVLLSASICVCRFAFKARLWVCCLRARARFLHACGAAGVLTMGFFHSHPGLCVTGYSTGTATRSQSCDGLGVRSKAAGNAYYQRRTLPSRVCVCVFVWLFVLEGIGGGARMRPAPHSEGELVKTLCLPFRGRPTHIRPRLGRRLAALSWCTRPRAWRRRHPLLSNIPVCTQFCRDKCARAAAAAAPPAHPHTRAHITRGPL